MSERTKYSASLAGLLIMGFVLVACSACGNSPTKPPKLVVLLVIDGFRQEYYERFADVLGEGGLTAIAGNGTSFRNARVGYFFSATSPGHATIATGRFPSSHGIVANYWWDREAGERIVCGRDDGYPLLGPAGESAHGASPAHLRGDHVVPVWRSHFGERARIFVVAGKDRSAVMFGGAGADGVYWFSGEAGGFVTSSWYAERIPDWVGRFNREQNPENSPGDTWDLLMPPEMAARAEKDDRSFEVDYLSMGITFPHTLFPGSEDDSLSCERLLHTPLVDEYTGDFVLKLIEEESLGMDEFPDLLMVSLSGLDYVGHLYGPYSLEVADAVWRVDRVIARLRRDLSDILDVDRECLFVVTSDHGMAPLPEEAIRRGHDAGRVLTVPLDESGDPVPDAVTLVEQSLTHVFGERDWVSSCSYPSVYLDSTVVTESGIPRELVLETGRKALLELPGVSRVFTGPEILSGIPGSGDRVLDSVRRWYDASRAGDLVIHVKPYYIFASASSYRQGGTNHGSLHPYDADIVLMFGGGEVPAGVVRDDEATQVDVLPSLLHLLGIVKLDRLDGRTLF